MSSSINTRGVRGQRAQHRIESLAANIEAMRRMRIVWSRPRGHPTVACPYTGVIVDGADLLQRLDKPQTLKGCHRATLQKVRARLLVSSRISVLVNECDPRTAPSQESRCGASGDACAHHDGVVMRGSHVNADLPVLADAGAC